MRNKEDILQEAEELSKDFKNPDKTVRKLDNLVLEVLLDIRELLTKKTDDAKKSPMDRHEAKTRCEDYFKEFREQSPKPHGVKLNIEPIGAFSEDASEKETWKKEPLLTKEENSKTEIKQNNKKKK